MAFAKNVFVNCPFDRDFYPLLRPLLFTIIYLGLRPRIALEDVDSGQSRIDKIVGLIASSKYAIHDLSRMEAQRAGDLFRLNMPFELGIDVGCRLFGSKLRSAKKCLVLEAEPYRYKAAISDLSGSDISYHGNEPDRIVGAVRNWLQNVCDLKKSPGPTAIWGAYTDFMAEDYDALTAEGFSPHDIEDLPVPELIERITDWVGRNDYSR